MATGAAAGDGFLRGVFEGCISGRDMSIQRRPYHKNCGCAFHKSGSSRGHCSHLKNNVVSYPIRRSWSEGSLALMDSSSSSSWSSLSSSTTTSPAVPGEKKIRRAHTQLVLCEDDDQELALVPT